MTRHLNLILFSSVVYIPASIIYFLLGYPFRGFVLAFAIVPIGILTFRIVEATKFIDAKLGNLVGTLSEYSVYTRSLPGYRFVDVYNAVLTYTRGSEWITLDSQHDVPLLQIVNGNFYNESDRFQKTAERIARQINESEEQFFPKDSFRVRLNTEIQGGAIIRVSLNSYTNEVVVEMAAMEQAVASDSIQEILKISTRDSIFRNRMIEVSFEQEVKDEYGDIERRESVDPLFLSKPPVTAADIILDDETIALIERAVIDFHNNRGKLVELGLPGRRGVLFYGPPGTGKTYTCRHIAHRLKDATTIVAAGMALLRIKSICNLARMLQPSVVILEDVDLVYSTREKNWYSTALGELMDELDGFSPDDSIIFVLTTNAIERVEDAIKERPGRISQCIYFGAPNPALREKYLKALMSGYDTSRVDFSELVKSTEGVTQAFLKELVFRAVQIASEEGFAEASGVTLSTEQFREALSEMRRFADGAGEAIIGFKV